MKDPQYFDPANPKQHLNTQQTSKQTDVERVYVPNTASMTQTKHKKSPPIPQGTPSITQNHKQNKKADKIPFQASFLHPRYWGIWLLFAILLPIIYLPLRWQFWLGRKLGILVYRLAKSRRHVTLVNLRLAFPEKLEEERVRLAKQVFVNQGIGVFETLCAWFRPNLFTRAVTISGLQHVVNAQNEGRGILFIGVHSTMLDLGGRLCTQFFPAQVMYRPQDNKLLNWVVFNARNNIYEEQIGHRNLRGLVKNLAEGAIIWYSPDHDFGLKRGVMAPFFGVPAATITTPRYLAQIHTANEDGSGIESGADRDGYLDKGYLDKGYVNNGYVDNGHAADNHTANDGFAKIKLAENSQNNAKKPALMGIHMYRQTPDNLPKGKRPHYHITITPEITNYPTDDEVADATRINELLESQIRIDPTQWMWFHKRYKHNETGRNDYYK